MKVQTDDARFALSRTRGAAPAWRSSALGILVGGAVVAGMTAWAAPEFARAGSPPLTNASPIPLEKSPVPKANEWDTATPFAPSRTSAAASSCVVTRVREWLRIKCATPTFAVSLLGGSNEGMSFWIGPEAEGQPGEAQFPLRRGDKRVVQLWSRGKDKDGGFVPVPSLVIQEHWLDDAPEPTVTIL